jgi:hypothetical protein
MSAVGEGSIHVTFVLKGAKTHSGGATILAYEAAEAVVAPDHTWLPCFSPGGWRCSMIRWQQSQRSMRSVTVVQVDNATPIVPSLETFVIRGIHGSVGLSRCTRR